MTLEELTGFQAVPNITDKQLKGMGIDIEEADRVGILERLTNRSTSLFSNMFDRMREE